MPVAEVQRLPLPFPFFEQFGLYRVVVDGDEEVATSGRLRPGVEALDAAVNRILVRAGVSLTPSLVVALVDGGAVKAISEGYDVREIARMLLDSAVALG